ncbi:3-oxoacyl-ACP synthase [Legionella busanensis]|uniref:3-oxoacyl-ACP synthase n=1 Tax=Legionella busanensis TaxID=190655 RepID=A0A378JJP5_9GAMM|nr:beta-ketoacyl-ACP synthase III [Legionella busanensis]STX50439.1 3-oxoacyl-ACP synthase [Legionella busanensis]
MGIQVLASGGFLPKKIINNKDFEQTLDTSEEWIERMTGIKNRHFLDENDDYLQCCYNAASSAIKRANINPQEIDLIIIGTSTPYQLMPSTAVMLQQTLGIHHCIAFDMQAACSGFVYALANAYYLMQSNRNVRYALVIGSDAFTQVTDPQDRATRILFGDGFGAFLLGNLNDEKKGIFYCDIGADGLGKNALEIPWGVAKGNALVSKSSPYVVMNGKEVFKNAVKRFTECISNALKSTQLTIMDIHHIIPHQANIRIINSVAANLEIPLNRIHVTLDKHGNTSAASIPLAFEDLFNLGSVKEGDIVLLVAFGAGYTWGTIIFEF